MSETRTISIVETATGEVVEVMDVTGMVGSNFDQFFDGLTRKVNFNDYHIVDSADKS